MFFKRVKQSVVCVVITLGVVGCSKTPDPQNDISLFKTFIAENIDKMSDDPYISSTVKPGDKMYEFLKYLQHGSGRNRLIQSLADGGDPEAMLWYARLNLGNPEIRGQVLKLMRDSMKAGNPYAALELSEGSESCTYYFGKNSTGNKLAEMAGLSASSNSDICTKENFAKAVEGFERLAKQGDLRAQYFLLKQKEWDKSEETRADYIREIIRFSEAHYYQPLMDYVSTILYYSKEAKRDVSNTQEQHDLAVQLLTIASNNNYIPAIESLINVDSKLVKDAPLYMSLLKLGSPEYYASRFYTFENEYSEEEKICFAFAYEKVTGDSKFFIWLNDESQKLRQKDGVEEQSECSFKKTAAMVYIDGFTQRESWRDR
ncbi:sel1 repeat family protein [Vibrio parahaemolyticus]|nr:sel1 repeat family protein [Vibrio parahaemolyticus]